MSLVCRWPNYTSSSAYPTHKVDVAGLQEGEKKPIKRNQRLLQHWRAAGGRALVACRDVTVSIYLDPCYLGYLSLAYYARWV